MHGAQVDDALDFRSVGHRGTNLLVVLRGDGFADQQALHLDREHERDPAEQDADRDRTRGVEARIARDHREPDARSREQQADQRAEVLEQHDRQLEVPV
jgi:hypothetical protein